jgi:hypothetical protein
MLEITSNNGGIPSIVVLALTVIMVSFRKSDEKNLKQSDSDSKTVDPVLVKEGGGFLIQS